ncbi:nuclear transport factor 2 family protein [Mycolicibacterium sp. HK-90]|uniref:nuclear transport factor 2 family protein n=1 Tax=Mycolicibacterium sp. HK-90 TaxID=3056937 RepID=UPI0026588344|nr:nuclear transport factor 2 family protein [Mycolicibacterium sp. HK-90]WKG03979.1 nuclear transport factor 2 family protein [Mycolicibacterium sp. HK-90]
MAEFNDRELEALESYRRYVAQRERCVAGEAPWSTIGEWFTEGAVFIDPAWGRVEGRDEITRFFDRSMVGFEGWSFPEEWTMVDGDRLVTFWWNCLPGTRADGTPHRAPALSVLHYAGEGVFDYELDLMNLAEVGELLVRTGWVPSADMSTPGPEPDRNVAPPRLPSP